MPAPLPKTLRIALLIVALGPFSQLAVGQSAVLELDHAYILVPPGAAEAVRTLHQAGVTIDTLGRRHDGEGTTSIAAFFENGYLELMWLDSSVAVDSAHQADVADFRRGVAWRETGASPVGLGLHFLSGDRADLGIPYTLDPVPDASPGTDYILLRQPAESLAADAFIMPAQDAVPAWIAKFQSRRPELFTHPSGFRRITRVLVRGPPTQRLRAAVLDLRLIRFEAAETPLLVVEFDGGLGGQTWDLRPALSLVLSR